MPTTHDYMVHSLRDWLTRKQKETRRGRAEIRLAERAAAWNAKQENRHLPAWWEWANIRLFTRKRSWTPPQRKMMRTAGRYYVVRSLVIAAFLTLLGWGTYEAHGTLQAHALRDRLLDANTTDVPTIVKDMAPYRRWLDPLLCDAHAQAEKEDNRRKQLHTSLALLPVDATQVDYLYGRLLDAEPPEVPVIRDFLAANKSDLVNRLWGGVEKPEKGKEQQRLRAACALASYDVPDNPLGTARWQRASTIIADELLAAVEKNPSHYATLLEQLRPVRASLLPPLTAVYRSKAKPEAGRSFATTILADYAAEKPDVLANLLMDADDKQFAVIYPKLREHGEKALALLTRDIEKRLLPVTMDWTVRFYRWEKVGKDKPPADWEAILKSPVLNELRTARLSLMGAEESPSPPIDGVPSTYFAVLATTELMLGDTEYILTITFDDGVRVWLDDRQVFENWGANPPSNKSLIIKGQGGAPHRQGRVFPDRRWIRS